MACLSLCQPQNKMRQCLIDHAPQAPVSVLFLPVLRWQVASIGRSPCLCAWQAHAYQYASSWAVNICIQASLERIDDQQLLTCPIQMPVSLDSFTLVFDLSNKAGIEKYRCSSPYDCDLWNDPIPQPANSIGIGSPMRISPISSCKWAMKIWLYIYETTQR